MFLKSLIVSIILFSTSVAQAETKRMVLMFSATWCGPCVSAKKMYHESDMVDLIAQYDDNLYIDVDKHPVWKRYFKVTSIPTFIIADTEVKNGKLYGTVLYRGVNQSKTTLKNALVQNLPKKPVKYRRPLLNLLRNPTDFLRNGLDSQQK
jgi:thiol-disulfide isomerase/thioredoxin